MIAGLVNNLFSSRLLPIKLVENFLDLQLCIKTLLCNEILALLKNGDIIINILA
jgi:hypothetical protein